MGRHSDDRIFNSMTSAKTLFPIEVAFTDGSWLGLQLYRTQFNP